MNETDEESVFFFFLAIIVNAFHGTEKKYDKEKLEKKKRKKFVLFSFEWKGEIIRKYCWIKWGIKTIISL